VLHPFAATPQKTRPAERFLAVAETLRDPVFLAGPDDDASKFAKYHVIQNAPLAEVKSIIAGAQLFIGNDSGPAHIAAAFGVPVVVLFGPSDPVNWAPWRTEGHVLTNPDAIDRISVGEVIAAADALRVRA
jgi:heptosyltransferase III